MFHVAFFWFVVLWAYIFCPNFQENSKSWTVCLDISAPQVIFPDDFKFVDPVLVVVDLGRILLTNSQGMI